MDRIAQLFLYIPGILLFLAGSGQTRGLFSGKKDSVIWGIVKKCSHIQKKDSQGRIAYDYYTVTIEYTNPKSSGKKRCDCKSPTPYLEGQNIRIEQGDQGVDRIWEDTEGKLFHPLELMILGALCILLALYENKGQEVPAMFMLTMIMLECGGVMLWRYISRKRMNLVPVTATVVSLYNRQISKESKIIKGNKYTWYPVVSYSWDGVESYRRCQINSSREKDFPIGSTITLYCNFEKKIVMEKHASVYLMVGGILLLALGILCGASILSVLLV